jgi:phage tail sheath protein FI
MRAGRAVVALGVALVAVAAKKAKKRVKAASDAYVKEVSSGARPIEAVGTAVAAFVGLG